MATLGRFTQRLLSGAKSSSFFGRNAVRSVSNTSSNSQHSQPAFAEESNNAEPVRMENWETTNMLEIGTRSIFSEEHDMLRSSIRRFVNDEVVPHHDKWEENGEVDRELWLKAGENGLLGINIPEEKGGLGGDWLATTIPMEELSYINCSGPGFALHSDIVMPYIARYGTAEQIEKFIPDMTAGIKIGALGMSEPSAGSDLQGIRTYAKQDGDDWIINGSKVFITNGYLSDVVVVVAVTNPQAKSPAHGISLFLIEEGMPGFKKGKKLKKLGLKAQDTSELFFDDVRVPSSAILGKPNQGFYMMMNELPQERLLIATICAASMEFMFETTRNYVAERKAFKGTLSNLQTIQHKIAEVYTDTVVARTFTDKCNQIHNDRGLDSTAASMAKYWVSDMQNQIATKCLQMHGGWGYMWEYPIAKAWADARVQAIYGGSNEIMKELIQRHCFKPYAKK